MYLFIVVNVGSTSKKPIIPIQSYNHFYQSSGLRWTPTDPILWTTITFISSVWWTLVDPILCTINFISPVRQTPVDSGGPLFVDYNRFYESSPSESGGLWWTPPDPFL